MKVDLSVLESMGKTAVRCTSNEQAELFMEAMWKQYPHLVEGVWQKGQTNWYDCGYDELGEICYKHRIVRGGDSVNFCQSFDPKTAARDGCMILDFSDIFDLDLGEFEASEFDMKSLFGMG